MMTVAYPMNFFRNKYKRRSNRSRAAYGQGLTVYPKNAMVNCVKINDNHNNEVFFQLLSKLVFNNNF